MSVLEFDKNSLGNLEYSLRREMLATNRAGGYMSTTIVLCNTRKYHGLMVCPVGGGERGFVFLSSLDETVLQHGEAFNLALHRYPGTYEPRGHKYLTDFRYTPTPAVTYRVGGAVLRKELLWIHSRQQLLVRYTLLEAHSETTLRLRPFLAFRDRHGLSKANMWADGGAYDIPGGVRCRLYTELPWLAMQTDDPAAEFAAAPDLYYDFEYAEERLRGYEYREDLLTPGYFETRITKDRPLVFSAALDEESDPASLARLFDGELSRRSDKKDFLSCLRHSARQFATRRDGRTEITAGYQWFGRWGRDTLISLPGITLAQGDVQTCREALDTLVGQMNGGLFPNMGDAYNSVDAPLWFFWTLQQLEPFVGAEEIWNAYGKPMREILASYRRGIGGHITLRPNGLVWASQPGRALTWMDAVVDGVPVTGRDGYQVEINALWYNAVCYALELAGRFGDERFVSQWREMPEITRKSFLRAFWLAGEGYLADYADERETNRFIRPNQIIACSLRYKMLPADMRESVAGVVRQHLLTPRGLRSLSPRNPLYTGRYEGGQPERDRAYHQGTVWVWPLEHYAAACFDLAGKDFLPQARSLLAAFDEGISDYGIGSAAEIYDGDPPHAPRGAVSQAWSVGALLRIAEMIEYYENRNKDHRL